MYVAAVQFDISWEDCTANLTKVRSLAAGARLREGAHLVLPEMFATGFSMNVGAIAEEEGGESERFLAALAAGGRIFVTGGVVVKAGDGRGLNQSVTFGPDGTLIARYTKVHPFSYAGESKHFRAGDEIVTYNGAEFKIAPFICYDLRFPEVFRQAVIHGAELFTVIANWPESREAHWLALLQARAIENQSYVVGINRCGFDPKQKYSGRSRIIGPRGDVLAEAGSSECVFGAELGLEPLQRYRAEFPFLKDIKSVR